MPGTDTPATTTAFGAVFTDVDQPDSTNPNNILNDPVVMDDFIYAEPQAVPEPASGVLTVLGLVGAKWVGARKRRREPAAS